MLKNMNHHKLHEIIKLFQKFTFGNKNNCVWGYVCTYLYVHARMCLHKHAIPIHPVLLFIMNILYGLLRNIPYFKVMAIFYAFFSRNFTAR